LFEENEFASQLNCADHEIEHEDGSFAIVIETVRSVARGEETLLDYGFDVGHADHGNFSWCCGASMCRGTMVAFE